MKKFRKAPAIPANSRLKTIASGTSEVFKLDPRHITREPGFNPRYDFGDISLLADDIEANGVLDPLKVRKDNTTVLLVNGDRRLTAIELLISEGRWPEDPKNPGYPTPVPCTSEGPNVKPLDRILMSLSLNTGKPFTMLEKGLSYLAVQELDPSISASEIARRSGETKQAVCNALTLAGDASPALLNHVRAGTMSATTALEICKAHPDHAAQDAAALAALQTAADHGQSRATPKDLPKKPKPAGDWLHTVREKHQWRDQNSIANDCNTVAATSIPLIGIERLELFAAHHPDGDWYSSYRLQAKGDLRFYTPNTDSPAYDTEAEAVIGAWLELADQIRDFAAAKSSLTRAAILTYGAKLNIVIHRMFPDGGELDDSLFDPPPAPAEDPKDPWDYQPTIDDFGWEGNTSTDPNTLEGRLPYIMRCELSAAQTSDGTWRGGFDIKLYTTGDGTHAPNLTDSAHPDESSAFIAAWRQAAPFIRAAAAAHKNCATILASAITHGQFLHARFPTGEDADDSLFDLARHVAPNPDAPADPEAFNRLKDAPATNRDGSGSNTPGGGYADTDARVKNIEELLDTIDESACSQERFATVELILDYLKGNHTITTIRDHLKNKS